MIHLIKATIYWILYRAKPKPASHVYAAFCLLAADQLHISYQQQRCFNELKAELKWNLEVAGQQS